MPDLPTGTLSFLLTDVQDSTRLWDHFPSEMGTSLERHDRLIEAAVDRAGGTLVRPRGEGDSRFAVFRSAGSAAAAAIDIQRAFADEPWVLPTPLKVRVALHSGEAELRENDYYGPVVNLCARLRSIAHGGQVLVSETTADLIRDRLPAGTSLRDSGTHRLKGLSEPERVFELVHEELPTDYPPPQASRAHAGVGPELWRPGHRPRIWHVPHPRNPNFAGRDEQLAQLRTTLMSGRPAALTQAITGLGGIGKTQLAVEYVYRHANEYEVVWWIRSEEPSFLGADYGALARALGLSEANEREQTRVVAAVREWLRQREDWLLVFDNAQNPADILPYLPTGAFGHALITSRHHTWRAVAQTVPVRVLPRAAAVRFVLERTGQQDERSARRICEVLGDLPLALEQAGAYIDATRRPLAEYLEIFAAHQQELLRREPAPSDYPGTVITTWEMALRQVSEISSASADLLNLCAFLAPDQIDRTLLAHGTEHLPRQLADALSAPLRFDEAVEPVLRYSLMEAKNGHLSMHRLVQAVTRDRLPRMDGAARRRPSWRWLRRGQHVDPQERWAEVAVRIVDGEFPEPNARSWSTCASLMPHALATVAHAEALHVAVSVTNHLLTQVGVYLGERAQFSEAQSVLERAVRTCEQSLGPDHPDTIASLTSLGFLIRTQGDLAGARPYFERAVTASDRALGQHPQTATCLEFLGSLMRAQGDLTGARPHIERALAIRTAVVGSEHQDTAVSLASLGTLLQALGEFDAARPYLEEALAISEKTVGLDDPLVATNVTNLGLLLQTQGDLQVALPLLERALAIREASFGSDYRDTWTSLSNLGGLLVALGDLDSARPHLERALSSYERALGPSHPHVASCLIHLGSLQQAEGDLATARANLERAVQIRERALGLEHPHTAASWFALGNLLRAAGDEHGARRYFERALAVREEKLGPDHPDTITSRASLENEYEPRPA